ncbi:GntR family transcriptional regulator [Ciceribacter sp. L1K22]|uniref:GntR family transcriptional regulator n=1 Tax=Ciceribacter sp. L1K22 TaxID=2820275 RepID=UPI001ABEC0DF|nr:GntR family transcriptional regulator [Ciceribacter sp. L1K22]MBO3760275.1 GntR family transcriptional regulator [Ciceribacter sp. L1K22]
MTLTLGSQSHRAYLDIEERIVTHRLAPGTLVTERELIDLSGHGRTPVREAIQKLAWQGLIEVRPRVGLRISAICPADHGKILAVRHLLEPMAASLVAENANDEQRAALVECARAMTSAATAGSYEAFLAADKRFDEILEAACPNPFLISALSPLQTHSRRLWYAGATPEKMDRSVLLHVAVIRAIQKGNAVEAETAMRRLIGALRDA